MGDRSSVDVGDITYGCAKLTCWESFPTQAEADHHHQAEHGGPVQPASTETDEPLEPEWECAVCHERFWIPSDRDRHFREEHQLTVDKMAALAVERAANEQETRVTETPWTACPYCGRSDFKNRAGMRSHAGRVHKDKPMPATDPPDPFMPDDAPAAEALEAEGLADLSPDARRAALGLDGPAPIDGQDFQGETAVAIAATIGDWISLTPRQQDQVEALAFQLRQSRAAVVQDIVTDYLRTLEGDPELEALLAIRSPRPE